MNNEFIPVTRSQTREGQVQLLNGGILSYIDTFMYTEFYTVSMANTRPISRFESEQIEKAKVGIAEVIAKLRDLENK